MSGHSVRVSTSAKRHKDHHAHQGGSTAIEPMLPALIRGVIFLAGLAAPFVVTLLMR